MFHASYDMNLNRAMIIGNLTRDPEIRTTPNGQTVANFSVATSHFWKDAAGVRQEKTEYHNIVAWAKLAEICQQYLGKGRKVYVDGRLQTRDWEGQDGVKRYRTEIIAENMIMLDRAPEGSGNFAPRTSASPSASSVPTTNDPASPAGRQKPTTNPPADDEIRVEDIPF
jgi:single-strand DNA-binding protein